MLTSYLTLRQLDRHSGILQWVSFYARRIWRYTYIVQQVVKIEVIIHDAMIVEFYQPTYYH